MVKARIQSIQGNEITFRLAEAFDIRDLQKLGEGQKLADIELIDNREITHQQRKFAFSLMADIAEYTGYLPEYIKDLLYNYHTILRGKERFSLSPKKCSVKEANDFLEDIIGFCFGNNIPFSGKEWQLDRATSNMLYMLTMNRKCWICGKHADLAHYEAVGQGRNRQKIDHTKHHFMALCRHHHQEQHALGVENFLNKYHIKPIKLKNDDLKKLMK